MVMAAHEDAGAVSWEFGEDAAGLRCSVLGIKAPTLNHQPLGGAPPEGRGGCPYVVHASCRQGYWPTVPEAAWQFISGHRSRRWRNSSVGAEVEDDDFFGLVRGRFPFTFTNRVEGGLREDWMSAEDGR